MSPSPAHRAWPDSWKAPQCTLAAKLVSQVAMTVALGSLMATGRALTVVVDYTTLWPGSALYAAPR